MRHGLHYSGGTVQRRSRRSRLLSECQSITSRGLSGSAAFLGVAVAGAPPIRHIIAAGCHGRIFPFGIRLGFPRDS